MTGGGEVYIFDSVSEGGEVYEFISSQDVSMAAMAGTLLQRTYII